MALKANAKVIFLSKAGQKFNLREENGSRNNNAHVSPFGKKPLCWALKTLGGGKTN